MEKILRLPDVKTLTGLSRSTIYNRVGEGTMPAPVSLGARAIGWKSSSIESWLQSLTSKKENALTLVPTIRENEKQPRRVRKIQKRGTT